MPLAEVKATCCTSLQWGRAHVSADIKRSVAYRNRNLWASMGPRSRERGHLARFGGHRIYSIASMGPRSRERGHLHNLTHHGFAGEASMGPRSRERGHRLDRRNDHGRFVASMGPRSRERGHSGPTSFQLVDSTCFNGAALT